MYNINFIIFQNFINIFFILNIFQNIHISLYKPLHKIHIIFLSIIFYTYFKIIFHFINFYYKIKLSFLAYIFNEVYFKKFLICRFYIFFIKFLIKILICKRSLKNTIIYQETINIIYLFNNLRKCIITITQSNYKISLNIM